MKNALMGLLLISFLACTSSKHTLVVLEKDFSNSKQDMLEDYDIFCSIFKEANAGLYKYRDSADVHKRFMANREKIQEHTTYREFYNILWNSIDYTGSCHNTLTYPDSIDTYLSKQPVYFPLPLKYINGRLYTNYNHTEIPAGSEILSVNGVSVKQFSSEIAQYVSTDGFNTTGKFTNIETDWLPFYIYLAYGPYKTFDIRFKYNNQKNRCTLEAVDYHKFYSYYKQRFSKPFEESMCASYDFKMLDSLNTGLLRVGTFAMGGPESKGHKTYAKFLEDTFKTLKDDNVEILILDMRGNGGGHDPNDLLLYSYVTKRNFRENISAFTLFQELPYQPYYVYDDSPELNEELREEHSVLRDGKYYQNTSFNKEWTPKANAFQGKIIVLIDPYIASAGSLFTSLIKSDESSYVIGEETLGGYYGHTGHIPVDYELPNTKLVLSFSIVDLDQDVQILKDQKKGDGVKPDLRVVQSYKDFMEGKDRVMIEAINLINDQY